VLTNQTHWYSLRSGALIAIETLPEIHRGVRDVANEPSGEDRIPFARVLEPLGEVCETLVESIKSSIKAPHKVTVELSASLKGKTGLVIVRGEAEGSIKVTLTWETAA
jgi:hypothetical protein